MELCGRALYNLLRITSQEDPNLKVKPWQVADYRSLSSKQLFENLKDLKVILDKNALEAYAEECDSPEDLLDCLWLDEGSEDDQEFCYLLLFELWRRLLPEKQSLSIFCDELDHCIELYDQGLLDDEEVLQKHLRDLEDVLDETVDRGQASPLEVFQNVSRYCAHDLEGFLYDYISDQIQSDNTIYASELLDACYDYVADKKWFDLLKAWLFANNDVEELNRVATGLFNDLLDAPDLDLLLEIAKFLVHRGDVRLFMQAIGRSLVLLKTEEQFQIILKLVAEYYRCLDKDSEQQHIQQLIQKRVGYNLERPVDPTDPAFKHISMLLSI